MSERDLLIINGTIGANVMPFFGMLVLFNANPCFACSIVWANLLWESDFIRTWTLLLVFNDAAPIKLQDHIFVNIAVVIDIVRVWFRL
jgi:hypothetical protein